MDQHYNSDKANPFLQSIRPKQSQFTLQVPTQFCFGNDVQNQVDHNSINKRKLFFSELRIVPDFYAQQATKLKIDSESELDINMDQTLRLSYMWNGLLEKEADLNDRPTIALRPVDFAADKLITELNAIAVQKQSAGQKYPAVFCDWIKIYGDIEEAVKDPNYEIFMNSIPDQSLDIYGVAYDEGVHRVSMLDAAIQSYPLVNNYAFPNIQGHDKGFRIRMFLQPGAAVTFSNINFLHMLGFADSQFTLSSRQYVVLNPSKTKWRIITALRPPRDQHDAESPRTPIKLSITYLYNHASSLSTEYKLKYTKRDFVDDDIMYAKLKRLIDKIGTELNIKIGVNLSNKSITFPSDPKLTCQMLLNTTFANRLQYGPVDSIDALSAKIPVSTDTFDVKAKTLVFDTGIIFVTARDTASNILTEYNEEFLASLEPQTEGIMKMVPYHSPYLANYFYVPNFYSGSNVIDLVFNLYTIQPDGKHVPLNWITGAYVIGNLRSRL